jgi:hypothetical protein
MISSSYRSTVIYTNGNTLTILIIKNYKKYVYNHHSFFDSLNVCLSSIRHMLSTQDNGLKLFHFGMLNTQRNGDHFFV